MVIQIDIYALVAISLACLLVGFVLATWMAHASRNRYRY
jgi:ABC-type spermidine/putrescine transport system permease subunit I